MMKNVTLAIDEQLLERAREKLRAVGKTVNQEFREHLKHVAGDNEDLERELEEFVRLSGKGDSKGWKWNREDAYEGRLR